MDVEGRCQSDIAVPRARKDYRAAAVRWIGLALCLFALNHPVSAIPITWTLSGVTFNDGGTATGSFVFDADTGLYTAISIVTSTNPILGLGTTYGVPTGVGTATLFDTVEALPAAGNDRLIFDFDLMSPLTNAGGAISINVGAGFPDAEGRCITNFCNVIGPPSRLITAGAVVAQSNGQVPEPDTLLLLALGLIVVAFLFRGNSR
jgi:PEP-CTERM motif